MQETIATVIKQNYQIECEAIATGKNINLSEYQKLKKRLSKPVKQQQEQPKSIPITAELIQKDDQGWYQQLQLHYFITVGRPSLAVGDREVS